MKCLIHYTQFIRALMLLTAISTSTPQSVVAENLTTQRFPSDAMRWNQTSLNLNVLGGELNLQSEFNLGAGIALGVYGTLVGKRETYQRKRTEDDGWSYQSHGLEGGLLLSRFSNDILMSGLFWTLAGGYRNLEARWFRPIVGGYTLAPDDETDEDGRLQRNYRQSGATGQARMGYRYASFDHAITVGGYIGIKHFENNVEGVQVRDENAMNEQEREEIQRLSATSPILGVELGLAL